MAVNVETKSVKIESEAVAINTSIRRMLVKDPLTGVETPNFSVVVTYAVTEHEISESGERIGVYRMLPSRDIVLAGDDLQVFSEKHIKVEDKDTTLFELLADTIDGIIRVNL